MNWLHKALRQHTLSSAINAEIHSFLFIWGGVRSFPFAEQMSPGPLGKLSSKLVYFPWCLTHANWTHLTRLSTKTSHQTLTARHTHLTSIVFALQKKMTAAETSRLFHPSGEHLSWQLFNLCYVAVSSHPHSLPVALWQMPLNCRWLNKASKVLS